jgi:hypothetical protein
VAIAGRQWHLPISGQTNSDATEQADRVNFYPLSAMVKILSACPPSTVPLADGNFIEFDGSQIQLLRRGRTQPEMSQNVRGQTGLEFWKA